MNYCLAILCMMIMAGCSVGNEKPQLLKKVKIAKIIQEKTPIFLREQANLISPLVVQVRPQVGGQIIEVHVKEGEEVKENDVLFQIDPRPYKANLDFAKATYAKDLATLQLAKDTVERYEKLVSGDFVAQITMDQYKSNVENAKAQSEADLANIETAQINLEWTTVRSPIDGKISIWQIDPGNIVVTNDQNAFTVIRSMDPLYAVFVVPQSDFAKVQKYYKKEKPLKVEFMFGDEKEPRGKGELFFIDNNISNTTGTILLKAVLPNEERKLWPGMFGHVRLILHYVDNAILMPEIAVMRGQDFSYIFVVKDDMTVEERKVTLGETVDDKYVVLSGVQPGEIVVTEGQINLKNGDKVSIQNPFTTEEKK